MQLKQKHRLSWQSVLVRTSPAILHTQTETNTLRSLSHQLMQCEKCHKFDITGTIVEKRDLFANCAVVHTGKEVFTENIGKPNIIKATKP